MPKANLYNLLGIPRTASMDAVRAAYRALAKRFHPDASAAPDGAAMFAEIAEAYEVLGDRAKRRDYDRSLAEGGRAERGVAADVGVSQGHYAWVNIATARKDEAPDVSEFDELYDTFFGSHKSNGRAPKRAGKSRETRTKSRRSKSS